MKIWQAITAIALLAFCLTNAATEEEQVVHFHPITPEEYEAILGLTNGSPVISEARLIESGLAAIKSLAAGIKTGFAAAWWLPTLLSTFGGTQKEKQINTDKVRDGYPLCVIRPGYFAEDDDDESSNRRRRKKKLPLAHCIVVVKQNEENGGVGGGVPHSGNPWSYPPPYPKPRPVITEKPATAPVDPAATYAYNPYYPYQNTAGYNPKYPGGYPPYYGYPGYYGTYPATAPVTEAPLTPAPPTTEEPAEEEPTEEESTEPPPPPPLSNIIKHKKRVHHSIHKHLQHRSAPRPAYDWPLTPDYGYIKSRSKKKKRDQVATHAHSQQQNYAQTASYPVGGYEQAYYPQFSYQSNYPKVSYTHALPYPAPVYRQLTTPKPTRKMTSFDSEEAENSAEYIKVRNN